MERDALQRALASVSPESLYRVVRDMVALDRTGAGGSVSASALMQAFAGGIDLSAGEEGWSAQLALTQAVKEVAAITPGVRYVEGDS
jgi:tripartite-type tricarboxylate transporter receptor subunit TctC